MNHLMNYETWETVQRIREVLNIKPERREKPVIIDNDTVKIDLDYKYNPEDINKDYYIPSRWKAEIKISLDTSTILGNSVICAACP